MHDFKYDLTERCHYTTITVKTVTDNFSCKQHIKSLSSLILPITNLNPQLS